MLPDSFWQRMKTVQTIHKRLYDSGKGWIVGKFILVLTHTGRKSGNRYNTPLQYEKIGGRVLRWGGSRPQGGLVLQPPCQPACPRQGGSG